MASLMTRIRALFATRVNGKRYQPEVHDTELQTYKQHHRTLLVGRGVVCWWSGLPTTNDAARKRNGRTLID